jgi:osmoprotectant transport system permease protein
VTDRPLIDWEWIATHLDDLWALTFEHIVLTVIAVSVGFLISFLLSLLVVRWRGAYGPITAVAGIMYTIPSLALFAVLVPITGLTATSALIALVSYTILILVRNIVTGIDGVPVDARDAADGMGFTRAGRLWRVDLPLASPVIVAGLRIATVTTIGLVTVSALIGQGGLGRLINEGLRTTFPTKTITGAVLSVLLAVIADIAFVLALRALTPWSRVRTRSST